MFRPRARLLLTTLLGLAALANLSAEAAVPWGFNVSPYVAVPVGPTAVFLTPGGGARLAGVGYLPVFNLGLGATADYAYLPLADNAGTLSALATGLEFSTQVPFAQGFSAGLRAGAGGYYAWANEAPAAWVINGWYGAGGNLSWGLPGGWVLAFEAGYRQRLGFNDEVTVSLSVGNQPAALTGVTPPVVLPEGFVPYSPNRRGLSLSGLKAGALFPVLAKSYETRPVVQLLFHNFESTAAEQIKLSVDWGLMGNGPQTLKIPERLGPGLEVQLDLPLSWNSKLWSGPEASVVSGQLRLSFVQNNRPVKADLPLTLKLSPRMAPSADPAAWPAFVSPQEPSFAAWSKAAAAAKASLKTALPADLQTLASLQAGWKLLAVATLPPSPTAQFPRVTLQTKKGTAQDQALLWAGLVDAAGLPAALAAAEDRCLAAWSPDNPTAVLPWFPQAASLVSGGRTWIVFDPTSPAATPVEAAQAAAQALKDRPAPRIVPLREAWKTLPPVPQPAGAAEAPPAAAAWTAGLKTASDQWLALGGQAVVAGLQSQADAASKADQPALYNRLGVALGRLGRWTEALTVLKKQASQGNRAALVNLGHVFLLSGQPKAALDPYQAALKLNAADLPALTGLSLAYRALGDAAMRKAAQTRVTQLNKALGAQLAALKPVSASDAFQPAEVALWQGWIVWKE